MSKQVSASEWKHRLGLAPHPEGGFYRQTYISAERLLEEHLPSRFNGPRSASTAICFLLEGRDFSAFHRIRQDEIWQFYTDSSLIIHEIDLEGQYRKTRLGINLEEGECPQAVVRAGHIFGATVCDREGYALVGCTVAPGFEFDDLELPRRADLVRQYPQHRAIIESLTRWS